MAAAKYEFVRCMGDVFVNTPDDKRCAHCEDATFAEFYAFVFDRFDRDVDEARGRLQRDLLTASRVSQSDKEMP